MKRKAIKFEILLEYFKIIFVYLYSKHALTFLIKHFFSYERVDELLFNRQTTSIDERRTQTKSFEGGSKQP